MSMPLIIIVLQMKDGNIVILPYSIQKGIWMKPLRLPLQHRALLYEMVPRIVYYSENEQLYFLGGRAGGNYLNTVMVLNVFNNTVYSAYNMWSKRGGHGAAELHGYIYVCGGFDERGPLDSVERYDLDTNKWEFMEPLLEAKGGLSLTALNDRLYCVGGWNGIRALTTTECYDPAVRQWTRVAPMPDGRYGIGLAPADGHLYIAGGRIDSDRWVVKNIMMVYDPNDDRWYKTLTSTFCIPDEYFMVPLMQQIWLVTFKQKEFLAYNAFHDQMIRPQQPSYLKSCWGIVGIVSVTERKI